MTKGKNTKGKNALKAVPASTTRVTRLKTKTTAKAADTADPGLMEPVANPLRPNSMFYSNASSISASRATPTHLAQQKRKRATTNLSEQGGEVVPQKSKLSPSCSLLY